MRCIFKVIKPHLHKDRLPADLFRNPPRGFAAPDPVHVD